MLPLGLLPIIALILTVAWLQQQTGRLASAVLVGALGWSFAIAIGMELLGALSAISFFPVLAAWLTAVVVMLVLLVRRGRRRTASRGSAQERLARIGLALFGGPALERLVNAALLAISGLTLLTALVYTPSNWDSQTYHLARLEHWIQNGSLAFYPTAIERQIELATFAEILVLQFHLLSGTDRFDNLVQWLAGAGSVLAVGAIAVSLGAAKHGAALARLAMASLPIAVLESTSTQNDLVVTFFLLCAAERLLAWRHERAFKDAAFMAIAAGLALATKGTAYLVGLPLGIWFLLENVRNGRRAIVPLITCAMLVLAPNIAHYSRNYSYSGSPLGGTSEVFTNAEWGVGAFAVNAARNVAVNFAAPHPRVNESITAAFATGLTFLGLDPDDPDLTFGPSAFWLSAAQNSEDFAGNPLQLVAGAIALLLVLFAVVPVQSTARRYSFCLTGAVLLFVIVLRWQPWITRLQLPLFGLTAPLLALLPLYSRRYVAVLLAAAMLVASLPALLLNKTRPLASSMFRLVVPQEFASRAVVADLSMSQEEMLFATRPELLPDYHAAVQYVTQHNASKIGLIMEGNDWEYPIWRFVRTAGLSGARLEHVGLQGRPARIAYPLGPFAPEAIIVTAAPRPEQIVVDGERFLKELDLEAIALYRKE